jgi:hypothetical protein
VRVEQTPKREDALHAPVQVLHARSCTDTAAPLAAFFSTAHLIYSYGYDSVPEAVQALKEPPARASERSLADYLPGYSPFTSRRK